MPILNYTTKISALKTVGEIQDLLARQGAREVLVEYDGCGEPEALTFGLLVKGVPVRFRLPARYMGVQRVLARDRRARPVHRTPEHARRVAWRVIKDWIEAQLALIQSEQAELAEVFLPYALYKDGVTTLYENYTQHLLTDGG